MSQLEHDIMAALVQRRFRDNAAARSAWSRVLQNYGWDSTPAGREEWANMVARGERFLRLCGVREGNNNNNAFRLVCSLGSPLN